MCELGDGRFDALQSFVVAALSATDSLSHLHIKGSFPVGDRDASVLSTFACDAAKHMAYVATVSVDDPLIPVSIIARKLTRVRRY